MERRRRRTAVAGIVLAMAMLALASPVARAADASLPYGINAHLPSSAVLDRILEAGIAWIRVDFNWFQMEPARGIYDWGPTDAVVDAAQARGLSVFATLAYTPGWANGGLGINVPASDHTDWYDFVRATVSRCRGRVTHWGMWNEPNHHQFFSGSVSQYIDDVLRTGAQAAKSADPTCVVLGPDLAHLQSDDWARWLKTVLAQAGDVLDIVTHHLYADTGNAVLRSLGGRVALRTPRKIMERTGTAGKPLWLTETGWRTDEISQDLQADYYQQVLEGVDRYGWVDKVFFYEIIDDPATTERWGILEGDLTPKEAFFRYQSYIAAHTMRVGPASDGTLPSAP